MEPPPVLRSLNMDDEWEEEEQLVLVELSGILNSDFLSKCRGPCKILDVDSEKPMMQVGQHVFEGDYEDALGTCVVFEEVPRKGKTNSGVDLKYLCHTMKKLTMKRIFLTEKKDGETATAGSDNEQKDTTHLSNQEENENTQGVMEDSMDNKDMENSAAEI
ncbi:general transcription factor 3C polypeptide 6 isoform X2 [Austrofundulus limnaeus]|uniref:General transcription factor 3C polypeptide 6 isoform X2 n=1 Tax=Austrofundulus limnaeus TaxID=52670 RepID=A0A2I4ATU4_AUSLI|nr:PREDICTED: general transcription factor 3C polypeptide 6 isoform X2 [Austrofundulus limnaeus]